MTAIEVVGVEPLLLKPEEAAAALRVGRTVVYQLMMAGTLPSVKVGGSRRVPMSALREYVDSLIERPS
ncbi:MAG: helix-turn-helix domain-containing protein [Nocardioidaceae bacterium]